MTAPSLLATLSARGVELWLEGDQLRYRAPQTALSPELLQQIRDAKPEIVAHLQAEQARPFALTPGQRALWFLHQANPSSPAYHIRFTVELVDDADPAVLDRAIRLLAARHAVLRTCYPLHDGEPVQLIRSDLDVSLRVATLAAGESAEAESDRPFCLETGPICRSTFFRRPGAAPLLQLSAHHIAFDYAALEILMTELRECYGALRLGVTPDLPKLPATYRDYVESDARRLSGEEGERLRKYWQTTLAGDLPHLELPTTHLRPAVQTWHGDTHHFHLSDRLTLALRHLARREGATLYTVMLAAWQTLLFRHTHQDDLLVGTPLSGRNRPEFEGIVGYFANPVVIRARMTGLTFRQLLAQSRQAVLDAVAHGDYPFALLLEHLHVPRDPSRSPLFQTTFVWDQRSDALVPGYPGDPLYTTNFTSEQRGANYDISLTVYDVAGPLRLALAYNTALFDSATVEGLGERLQTLLHGIVAAPDVTLDCLPIEAATHIAPPPPEAPADTACLSYHQERLWFIDRFETGGVYPGRPEYHNISGQLCFSAPPDAERLAQAFAAALDRHGLLRMRVEQQGDRLILRRHPTESAATLDIAGNTATLTVNHFFADAWTVRLLLDELLLWGGPPACPSREAASLVPQYTRFAEAQRNLPLDALRRYWFHALRGTLQPLTLPYDHPRAAIHVFQWGSHSWLLPPFGAAQSNTNSASQEIELLAAFTAVLRRYSRQDEVLLGVADSGRTPGFESMAGPRANLLVLRARLDAETTGQALLHQMGEQLAAAREHREMPFDLLVKELNPPKDMSRTALFDVLFSYHPNLDFETEDVTYKASARGYGKYDLHLQITNQRAELVYNREVFDTATAEAIARHWSRLVDALAADPTRPIDEIELLDDAERHLQLEVWNQTRVAWPEAATLPQKFREAAARFPERIAVTHAGRAMTYRELDERSNHLAAELLAAGVAPQELVALFLDRDALVPVAILGVLKAGAAYLPLDPAIPPPRLQFILDDAACRHIVVGRSTPSAAAAPAGLVTILLDDAPERRTAVAPAAPPRPDHLAYCIYTSGSTGHPKGVLLEHRQVIRLFFNDAPLFHFTEDDVWTLFHSYSFDFSVWELFGALLFGGRLVIVPSETAADAPAMLALLASEKVTILNQTPPSFVPLAEEAVRTAALLAVRLVIFGGQQLDPVKLRAFRRHYPHIQLVNMYGITETCVHVTYREILDADMDCPFSPIGRPIPTLQTYIVDALLRLVPRGVTGELLVGGDGLARGYLHRDELTRERFIPHPFRPGERVYRSGDRVRQLADGQLIYEGRLDDQLQIRGFRVELSEIRRALFTQAIVADAHVAPWGEGDRTQLVAWVAPRVDVRETERRLARFRREAVNPEWSRFELPNGMLIATRNSSETEFTYDEIFEQHSYLRRGVHLPDGAVVIDAGANIGVFSLFAATACRDARIFALEPIPQTCEILRINAALYDFQIAVFNCGLAAHEQSATFTHYPNVSIFSGRFADSEQEGAIIRAYILNQAAATGAPAPTDAEIEILLQERFQGCPVECRLTSLSQIIREQSLDRIDLLKLDVERSELDALHGIAPADWPKIRQIVIEAHGGPAEIECILDLLRAQGFQVEVEQEEALAHTPICNIFAVRESGQTADASRFLTRANPMRNSAPALVRELRAQLRRELPEYMMPGAIVLVDALPLNANGKVDTHRLPSPDRAAVSGAEYVAPRGPLESHIAEIWAEVLGLHRVGVFDSFFDLGGHSLLAMRVISRLRQSFAIDFPVHALFQNPTVAGTAETVQQLQLSEQPDEIESLLAQMENLSDERAEELMTFRAGQGDGS